MACATLIKRLQALGGFLAFLCTVLRRRDVRDTVIVRMVIPAFEGLRYHV